MTHTPSTTRCKRDWPCTEYVIYLYQVGFYRVFMFWCMQSRMYICFSCLICQPSLCHWANNELSRPPFALYFRCLVAFLINLISCGCVGSAKSPHTCSITHACMCQGLSIDKWLVSVYTELRSAERRELYLYLMYISIYVSNIRSERRSD